ncbi:FGGY family carbohydrate kinase, partial [Klebsiella pneumoniae]|uniref:FGGY family carbohydrate kinase n=1 Tax=Klebsiella pneumoniae TaxID=573 RepID=UPI0021D52825
SWLLWNLTAGEAFCCDYSNAARTQLLNLHRGEWDDEMLALFGHALGEAGCVKATYGTGSSVMAPVKSAQCDIDALATTVA